MSDMGIMTKRLQREKLLGRRKLKAKRTLHEDPRLKLLADCAKNGWTDRLKKLLDSDQCPVQLAIDNAFLIACEHGQLETSKLLASKSSSANFTNKRGDPALILAARKGHTHIADFLLSKGVSIETRDVNGDTALIAAVEAGMEEMVAWLVMKGADVNAMDDDRNSVLHVAAFCGDVELVRFLLNAGAFACVINDEDETPLEITNHPGVVQTILEYYQTPLCSVNDAIESPFKELPGGAVSYLFWSAIGVGKDNFMFQTFGVYPFDRLNDTERIILLTRIGEGVSGYRKNVAVDLLHESALVAVFAMIKARIRKEIKDTEADDIYEHSFTWRTRVLEAYEQLYDVSDSGLCEECTKQRIWDGVVDQICKFLFGPSLWEKKRLIECPYPPERISIAKTVSSSYFEYSLPSCEQQSQSAVQLTFKKLTTMSKSFLCERFMESSGCYCQDCIAERELPLTFKLQFLEETAEENRKKKKKKVTPIKCCQVHTEEENVSHVLQNHKTELSNFWDSLSTEQRWALTELSTVEVQDIINENPQWETLRAALSSYTKYSWNEDRLEISDDCVIAMQEEDMFQMIYEGVQLVKTPLPPPNFCSYSYMMENHSEIAEFVDNEETKLQLDKLNEEDWDLRGRKMLENVVLNEFGVKIAQLYLLKKEESRAQRAALELELELLQEEEEKEKKAKKKKSKSKKKKRKKNVDEIIEAVEGLDLTMEGNEQMFSDSESPQITATDSAIELASDNPFLMLTKSTEEVSTVKSTPLEQAEDGDSEFIVAETESERPLVSESCESHSLPTSGMMFICTDETIEEIMELQLMGLPRQHLRSVRSLDPDNCALFLFNITSRMLYGIFEADGPGGENISVSAWSRHKQYARSSPFPAQIPFRVYLECFPVPESSFRHLFPDGNRIRKLNASQVRDLYDIFIEYEEVEDDSGEVESVAVPEESVEERPDVFVVSPEDPLVVNQTRPVALEEPKPSPSLMLFGGWDSIWKPSENPWKSQVKSANPPPVAWNGHHTATWASAPSTPVQSWGVPGSSFMGSRFPKF